LLGAPFFGTIPFVGYSISFEGHEFRLPDGESVVGRDGACEIRLDDPSVSRRHARLLVIDDRLTVEDLKSKNGVKLNGFQITAPTGLNDGDIIQLGTHEFVVRRTEAFDLQETTRKDSAEGARYRAPIYRTCIACRGLLESTDDRCPHCGSEQVVRKYPTMRFWRDPAGRRRFYRKVVRMRGLYVSPAMTIEGEVSDISTGGAFFASEILDEMGSTCDLLVFPSADGEVVRFSAEVVRTTHAGPGKSGMGLRFIKMTAAAQLWVLAAADPPDEP
jgi:hypothetical protein